MFTFRYKTATILVQKCNHNDSHNDARPYGLFASVAIIVTIFFSSQEL